MVEFPGEGCRPESRFSSATAAPPLIHAQSHTQSHTPSHAQSQQSPAGHFFHPQRHSLSHSFSFSHPVPSPARSPSPSSSSTSSRYYSPTSTPYPVVYSSPSLLDSARSSAHYRHSHPHSPPLYSSPFNDPLGERHSTSSVITDPLSSTTDPDYFFPKLVLSNHPRTTMSSTQQTDPPASSSLQPPPAALTMDTAQSHSHAPTDDLELGPASRRIDTQPSEAEEEANATLARPRSVVEYAIDSANANPAGRRVRRNMIARLRSRWENVPRNSRIVLCLTGIMTIAKVAATIAVLIVDKDADCMFLKVLLILYASRSAIGLPFTVYTHLHPRIQGAPLTTQDILLERQRTLMEIAGTCLFFLSNYFLFTQPACRQEAPALFYMTIVYVVLGYIVILVPILLCLAVILCLPLVLRVMRALDLGPVVGVKGATEEMIAAIPIVKYRKPAAIEQEGDGAVPTTTINVDMQSSADSSPAGVAGIDHIETTTSATAAAAAAAAPTLTSRNSGLHISNSSSIIVPRSRPKRSFFGLFQRSKKGALSSSEKSADKSSTQTAPVEYLTLDDAQDAVCAICLCDYEDEEELRKMKCSHYFHKDCVDEWLRLHRNCPLCKRDIEELSGLREGAASSSSSSPETSSAPERSILAPLVRTLSSPTRPT